MDTRTLLEQVYGLDAQAVLAAGGLATPGIEHEAAVAADPLEISLTGQLALRIHAIAYGIAQTCGRNESAILFADHAVERLLAFGCADRGRHCLSLLLRTMADCRGRQTDPDYLDLPALLDQGCAQPTRAEEIAHLDALLAEHAAKARLYAPLRGRDLESGPPGLRLPLLDLEPDRAGTPPGGDDRLLWRIGVGRTPTRPRRVEARRSGSACPGRFRRQASGGDQARHGGQLHHGAELQMQTRVILEGRSGRPPISRSLIPHRGVREPGHGRTYGRASAARVSSLEVARGRKHAISVAGGMAGTGPVTTPP